MFIEKLSWNVCIAKIKFKGISLQFSTAGFLFVIEKEKRFFILYQKRFLANCFVRIYVISSVKLTLKREIS